MSRKVSLETVHIVPGPGGEIALVSTLETDDGPKVDKAVERSREFYVALVNAIPPGYTRVLKLKTLEGDEEVEKYYRISVTVHDSVEEREQKVEVIR